MWRDVILPIIGAALILLDLADIFLTVLYARSGWGVLSQHLGRWIWRGYRRIGRWFKDSTRDAILSFAGPSVLVAMVSMWLAGLIIGFAMVVWPKLGTEIYSQSGGAPPGFLTALYVSGSALTTVGVGDMTPSSGFTRMLLVLDSILGFSVITLTLTYFLEIYNALMRRNTIALQLHHAASNTADAAQVLAGIGTGGDFSEARRQIGSIGTAMLNLYESQHFYPSLLYFRFREPHYAMARIALVVMDLASLVRTALDDKRYASIVESGAVNQLWLGGMQLLTDIADTFIPADEPAPSGDREEAVVEAWKRRYAAAAQALRSAGIGTAGDEQAGARKYAELRREWEPYITSLARYMEHDMAGIDPATAASGESR